MIWNFLKRLLSPRPEPLAVFGRTDTGRTRANNEDSFAILPAARLMMVADGMGGHKAGEVASRAAIESMVRLVGQGTMGRAGENREAIRHLMIRSLRQTNDNIMAMASENPDYSGMGCTFILGYVGHGHLYTGHVGDVRAYLLSRDVFRQLTTDHTYAAEYTKAHPDDATAPDPFRPRLNRNIVSRAIGFPFPEDPEWTCTQVAKGDRLLLCSDGLWSMVDDSQLAMILTLATTPEEACDRMINDANQAGGRDNITAVVAFV